MKYLFQILVLVFFANLHAQNSKTVADSLYLQGNYSKAIEAYKSYESNDKVYEKIAKAYIALGN